MQERETQVGVLDKAVKERQQPRAEAAPDARNARQLVSDADRLTEQRKFDEVVTDWEKARFFERM